MELTLGARSRGGFGLTRVCESCWAGSGTLLTLSLCTDITGPIILQSYRAIADYKKNSGTELDLAAGDTVEVVEKGESGQSPPNLPTPSVVNPSDPPAPPEVSTPEAPSGFSQGSVLRQTWGASMPTYCRSPIFWTPATCTPDSVGSRFCGL